MVSTSLESVSQSTLRKLEWGFIPGMKPKSLFAFHLDKIECPNKLAMLTQQMCLSTHEVHLWSQTH